MKKKFLIRFGIALLILAIDTFGIAVICAIKGIQNISIASGLLVINFWGFFLINQMNIRAKINNRHIILMVIITVFVVLLAGSAVRLVQRHRFEQTIADIPAFCLPQVPGGAPFCNTQLKAGRAVVLLYIDPQCEVCQGEIRQLLAKSDLTKDIQWLVASPVPADTLKRFAADFKLEALPNVVVVADTVGTLLQRLQPKGIPACYVYNRQHRLVEAVEGFVKIETIEKWIESK